MFFYILLIPALLMLLIMILKIRKISKDDIVLYRFCQVRRDIMGFLRDNYTTIKKDDYIALTKLLDMTSTTIHEYNTIKSDIFNYRKFINTIKIFDDKKREINGFKMSKNKDIISLYKEFDYALLMAFITHTPFIKTEIIFNLMVSILKLTSKRLAHSIKTIEQAKKEYNSLNYRDIKIA